MTYLDAYHLSSSETAADRKERIRMDRTCMACGFDDITASGHECPGYPRTGVEWPDMPRTPGARQT